MSEHTTQTGQGTPRPRMTPEAFRTKVKADLRQAIWEASQIMSSDDIKGFVDGVCEEIESDAA